MDNVYPFLVQNTHSEKHHVVVGKDKHIDKQKTFCGWLRGEMDCREVSKTISDAVEERSLCKICLMSDEVYKILAEEIEKRKEFQPSA